MKPMTTTQRETFSKMLDACGERRKAEDKNDLKEYKKHDRKLSQLEEILKDDMGEDGYNEFINAGRRMFA